MTRIEVVDEVTDELVEALAHLIPQLSSSASPPGRDELQLLVRSDATTLLVARDAEGRIVGSLTLALFRTPTGLRAWIEDVVVDAGSRGAGLGVTLTEEALEIARRAGARTVDLTSRPSREAANALYRRVGFTQRETNVYRFRVSER